MMQKKKRFVSILILLIVLCLGISNAKAKSRDLSPIDFGLFEAKNGVDRYNCLYRTHCAAIAAGVNVTYKGIDSLYIEIPKNARSIPLTEHNDFSGIVLTVVNNAKTHFLFQMTRNAIEIQIDKNSIAKGDFLRYPAISRGYVVLLLQDRTPWVKNRRGFEYGAERRDIICLKDGKAQNGVVSTYDTPSSDPVVHYYISSPKSKTISNITFIRDPKNTMRAYLVQLSNQNNVEISNIRCDTPPSGIYGDMLIQLTDCSNISFKNIVINGTYSHVKKSGYGISMNNVYNVSFYHLFAKANWGVFGNNNVNNVRLKKCDINRFDVHCYGRDVFFDDCRFRNLYNQFSSMYGTVSFKRCEFFDFTPVLFEPSYDAYTKFDLRFKNCKIHARKNKDFLISAGELTGARTKERSELSLQQFPNLYIDGLKIDMPDGIDTYYIYNFRKNIIITPEVEGIRRIRRIEFISKKNDQRLITVDTRNQEILIGKGGLTLLGRITSLFAVYGRRNKNMNHS